MAIYSTTCDYPSSGRCLRADASLHRSPERRPLGPCLRRGRRSPTVAAGSPYDRPRAHTIAPRDLVDEARTATRTSCSDLDIVAVSTTMGAIGMELIAVEVGLVARTGATIGWRRAPNGVAENASPFVGWPNETGRRFAVAHASSSIADETASSTSQSANDA